MAKPFFFAVLGSSLEDPNGFADAIAMRGFVDMLRYDRCLVHRIEGSVLILQTERPPTEARWKSFGIPVWAITHDEYMTMSQVRVEARGLLNSKEEENRSFPESHNHVDDILDNR